MNDNQNTTPLHISEALRRGLATIKMHDEEGKRLPTFYNSIFSPLDRLKPMWRRTNEAN